MIAALLNHLWQSSAFLAAAAGLAWLLRGHSARLRFAVWQAASLKFLLPFAAVAALAPAHAAAPPAAAVARMAQPFAMPGPAADFSPLAMPPIAQQADWKVWLFALWLAGAIGVLGVWMLRWRRVAAAKRAGRAVAGAMPTVLTDAGIEPGVFGICRPVLLLPADLAARLSPQQMQAVVAHEICHARRRDNLWSALHVLVTALLWFFPPVWWLGSRLVAERERACDEAVLAGGADAAAYAAGVLQVCRFYTCAPAACAAGVAGGEMSQRVRGILSFAGLRRLSRAAQLGLATLLVTAIAAPIAGRQLFAQQTSKPQFDAATIRNWNGSEPAGAYGVGLKRTPGRFASDCTSLFALAAFAYDLKGQEPVIGAPDWWNAPCGGGGGMLNVFQFEATFPPATPDAQVREMMQAFLAVRFRLAVHWATKQMPAYDLVVAQKGLKIKASDPEKDIPIGSPAWRAMNACPVGAPHCFRWCCGSSTMESLAVFVDHRMGRPVFDKTSLTGNFYFDHFVWAGDDPSDVPLPTLPEVLHNQFGLDLKLATGPVPVLVIDHVEKLRSESQ